MVFNVDKVIRSVVVFFLLGDSFASEFYMPTFRNTLSNLHRLFQSVGIYGSHAGESPKRKHTAFTTLRKFEIKSSAEYFSSVSALCTEDVHVCSVFI